MKLSKLNIGLALSRNFDKVTLEMVDEPIEYETEEQLRAQIRQRYDFLRQEVEKIFKEIQKR